MKLWNLLYFVACAYSVEIRSPRRDSISKSIVDEPQCEEVKKLCVGLVENKDILILECLYSLEPNVLNNLNHDCQNIIWEHTHALIDNQNVRTVLSPACSAESISCPADSEPGSYLKCFLNHKEEIHSSDCITMVLRLKDVAFHDFHWIANFVQHCTDDIKKKKCGRIDGDSLTQSVTIACLQNDLNNLQETCKREVIIFKISSLRSLLTLYYFLRRYLNCQKCRQIT